MGGEGSGRKANPTNSYGTNLVAFNNVPPIQDGQVYLPNFMGLQAVKKSDPTVGGSGLSVVDDGTYITVTHGVTALFRITKADGQMAVLGGYDSDTTI